MSWKGRMGVGLATAAVLSAAVAAHADALVSDVAYTLGTCQSHRCVRDDSARVCNPNDVVCGQYADGTPCEMLMCEVTNDGDSKIHVYLGVVGDNGLDQTHLLSLFSPGGMTGMSFVAPGPLQCFAEALEPAARFHLDAWPLEVMP